MSEYRGHLEECLRQFASRFIEAFPKGSYKGTEPKRIMAGFCGVTVGTITGWFLRDANLPKGEIRIKLICYLEVNGYKIIEFERIPQKYRNFSRLIGFGLISADQAIEMLGYTQTSSLFSMLRGEVAAGADRDEKLWDMWMIRKDKLDAVMEKAKVELRFDYSNTSTNEPETQVQQVKTPLQLQPANTQVQGCSKDGVVDIMHGLLKILDGGFMQSFTDADWVALRASSSPTILRLSSHMSSISAKLMGQG